MARFQRTRGGEQEQRAATLELFFDLVFVFAITQVSHVILDHGVTWEYAGQAALCLLVVWWAWNYTTWVTNELDPESTVVRLLMIGLMLASLLMAIAIPEAFGDTAPLFAGSYVSIQVGRHLFLTFAAAERGTVERERAGRILTWFVAAGTLWIAGAIADDGVRTALWLLALALDYGAPLVLFWVPGRPRLAGETWQVETAHFAERFALFVIIALGETIVLTGATTAESELDFATVAAFGGAFLGTAALSWLYFTSIAASPSRRSPCRRSHPARPRRLHLWARPDHRGHRPRRRRRRARDRPSDRGASDRGADRRRRRPDHLPAGPGPLAVADDRRDQRPTARRSARLCSGGVHRHRGDGRGSRRAAGARPGRGGNCRHDRRCPAPTATGRNRVNA